MKTRTASAARAVPAAQAATLSYELGSTVQEMLEVTRAVAAGDLQQVLDRVAAAATSVIRDARASSIVLVGPVDGRLRLVAQQGLSSRYVHAMGLDPTILRDGATGSAIASGEIVWVENMLVDPKCSRMRESAIAEGLISFLAVPLKTLGDIVGAMCVYRSIPGSWDSDEIALLQVFAQHAAEAVQTTRLLAEQRDQIEGLTRIVDVLRAQTHEHANRLHALHGLLHLGAVNEAQEFLTDLLNNHRNVSADISRSIRVPALAGLLTAMIGTAAHRGVALEIDPDSRIDELPPTLSVARLISVVGNLLDNAIDAVCDLDEDQRRVEIYVRQDEKGIRIEVADHGPGLSDDIETLCREGFSSKPDHPGYGLSVVRNIVDDAGGCFTVETDLPGAHFVVVLPLSPETQRDLP